MFNNLKLSLAKNAINQFISGIGIVHELEIDRSAKTIVAQVMMEGEAQPIRVEATGYIVGPDYIAISRFLCDKPWVEAALNRFLAGREIKIPEKAGSAIKMIF